jgi:hypothetical protein
MFTFLYHLKLHCSVFYYFPAALTSWPPCLPKTPSNLLPMTKHKIRLILFFKIKSMATTGYQKPGANPIKYFGHVIYDLGG